MLRSPLGCCGPTRPMPNSKRPGAANWIACINKSSMISTNSLVPSASRRPERARREIPNAEERGGGAGRRRFVPGECGSSRWTPAQFGHLCGPRRPLHSSEQGCSHPLVAGRFELFALGDCSALHARIQSRCEKRPVSGSIVKTSVRVKKSQPATFTLPLPLNTCAV